MNCWEITQFVVEILFVLVTVALVIVTVFVNKRIIKITQERNKEIDDWNKYVEELRVLPIINIRIPEITEEYKPITFDSNYNCGWFKRFDLIVENVGSGPVLYLNISAEQESNTFATSFSLKETSAMLAPAERRRISFSTSEESSKYLGEPPHIELTASLRDVYARLITIRYKILHSFFEGQAYLASVDVESLNIDGEDRYIMENFGDQYKHVSLSKKEDEG